MGTVSNWHSTFERLEPCSTGEVGRDEAAVAEMPAMVMKRKLFIRSRNDDIKALGEIVLSNLQRVSLCRFK